MAGHNLSIQGYALSPFETNCYIVSDPSTGKALVIDPAEPNERLVDAIRRGGFSVRGIVNTHGHADHIAGNGLIKAEFGCPILVHELDAPALVDTELNLSSIAGFGVVDGPPADRLLHDGDQITIGSVVLQVIHTPGHTPGGICLLAGKTLFSGDTLFAGSIGRTDFPGGSMDQLLTSIRTRLLVLEDDVTAYPGHGPATTIGEERAHNPWLAR